MTWMALMWFVVMLIVRRYALSPALVGRETPGNELSAQAAPTKAHL
jgi:hypothetical protein